MNYHRRSKTKQRALLLTGVVMALLTLTLFRVPLPATLQDAARSVAAPFLAAGTSLTQLRYSATALLIPKDDLIREQILLRERIESLQYLKNENAFLQQENTELRSLLGYSRTYSFMARPVIAHPPETPYDTLIISTLGAPIKNDTLVFGTEGPTVIGRVSRLLGKTADVTLFSHPDTSLALRIGEENIPAQTKGASGGSMTARVPQSAPITVGDTVRLTTTEETYTLGSVKRIENHTHDAEATVYIQLPVNIFTLTNVFISDNSEPLPSSVYETPTATTTYEEL